MKTSELIEQLGKLPPDQEVYVSIDESEITSINDVKSAPAFSDGPPQTIIYVSAC